MLCFPGASDGKLAVEAFDQYDDTLRRLVPRLCTTPHFPSIHDLLDRENLWPLFTAVGTAAISCQVDVQLATPYISRLVGEETLKQDPPVLKHWFKTLLASPGGIDAASHIWKSLVSQHLRSERFTTLPPGDVVGAEIYGCREDITIHHTTPYGSGSTMSDDLGRYRLTDFGNRGGVLFIPEKDSRDDVGEFLMVKEHLLGLKDGVKDGELVKMNRTERWEWQMMPVILQAAVNGREEVEWGRVEKIVGAMPEGGRRVVTVVFVVPKMGVIRGENEEEQGLKVCEGLRRLREKWPGAVVERRVVVMGVEVMEGRERL